MNINACCIIGVLFITAMSLNAKEVDVDALFKGCFEKSQDWDSSLAACMEAHKEVSAKKLNLSIRMIKKNIKHNYDDPFHLNDLEGEKINDVVLRDFDKAQQAWENNKHLLCEANANLMGEWAATHGIEVAVCEIKMNQRRMEELYQLNHAW